MKFKYFIPFFIYHTNTDNHLFCVGFARMETISKRGNDKHNRSMCYVVFCWSDIFQRDPISIEGQNER